MSGPGVIATSTAVVRCAVVTELGGDVDRVVTAFPQSNDPRSVSWQQ
jgi:hypothetical protein